MKLCYSYYYYVEINEIITTAMKINGYSLQKGNNKLIKDRKNDQLNVWNHLIRTNGTAKSQKDAQTHNNNN